MGKIEYIKKARKKHTCSKCGKPIAIGEPYKKGVINFHPDIVVCSRCPLRSYEVTTSEYCKQVGAIVEDWEDNYGINAETIDNIVSVLEDLRDNVESNLDNMPDNLRESSSTGELLQTRFDQLEEAIDQLNDIDVESVESDAKEEAENSVNKDDYETLSEWEEDVNQGKAEIFESNLSELITDVLSSLDY